MKQTLYSMLFAVAAFTAACSDEGYISSDGGGSEEFGQVEFTASASAEVEGVTRATVTLPVSVIPTTDKLSLHITGTYIDELGQSQSYDEQYPSIGKYTSPKMRRSTYTATIQCGDMESEGATAACFSGTADFTILARKTISAPITASLQNAAFKVVFDPWFTKYYKESKITIRTESNHSFTFTPASTSIIFIKPGTKLFMRGEALKSQTDVEVLFPETLVGSSTARTLHTLTIKASEAGSGKLTIDLDDTFTEVEEQIVELNPDAV